MISEIESCINFYDPTLPQAFLIHANIFYFFLNYIVDPTFF